MTELALITGASSGIGEALALQLAERGVELIVTGRNRERLEKLPGEVIVADLAQDPSLVIKAIHERAPDLVINNAGYGLYGHALSRPTSESLEMLQLNMMACTELTLEAARTMASRGKRGTVMNVSSVAGFLTFPHFSLYGASKTYVTQMSRSLDFEFQPQGVRVLAACPGQVRTGFRGRAGGEGEGRDNLAVMSPEYAAKKILKQIDTGRGVLTFNWLYRLAKLTWLLPLPKQLRLKLLRDNIDARYPQRPILPI